MGAASAPLSRTTPIPPRPGGVAMATMVSAVENTAPCQPPRYRGAMITVFSNASPMLSEVTFSTSATARWTIRRS